MSLGALDRLLRVATCAIGILAFIDASGNGASLALAAFMAVWACFPTALALALCGRNGCGRPGWALLTYGIVTSLGGLAVFGSLAVAGPPDPNTARHLAPFLWPVIVFFSGVCFATVTWVVERAP